HRHRPEPEVGPRPWRIARVVHVRFGIRGQGAEPCDLARAPSKVDAVTRQPRIAVGDYRPGAGAGLYQTEHVVDVLLPAPFVHVAGRIAGGDAVWNGIVVQDAPGPQPAGKRIGADVLDEIQDVCVVDRVAGATR